MSKACKRIVRYGFQCIGRDTTSPKLFAQPVSNLSRTMAHVGLQSEAYTTNRLAAYSDRKIRFRFNADDDVEPRVVRR